MTACKGTNSISSSAEGPDKDIHFNQQRDLMKTSISSSAEGPDEDIHFNQKRDLMETFISISRGT